MMGPGVGVVVKSGRVLWEPCARLPGTARVQILPVGGSSLAVLFGLGGVNAPPRCVRALDRHGWARPFVVHPSSGSLLARIRLVTLEREQKRCRLREA